jgi:hypothetical protein
MLSYRDAPGDGGTVRDAFSESVYKNKNISPKFLTRRKERPSPSCTVPIAALSYPHN